MKELLKRQNELLNKLDEIDEKENKIYEKIESLFNIDCVKDMSLSLNIHPKVALTIYFVTNHSNGYLLELTLFENDYNIVVRNNEGKLDLLIDLEQLVSHIKDVLLVFPYYDELKELKNLEKEAYKVRYEIENIEAEIKSKEVQKDYEEVNIEDLLEKAKENKDELIMFYTFTERGYAINHRLIYKNNRFRVDGKMISKDKIKSQFNKVFVKKGN